MNVVAISGIEPVPNSPGRFSCAFANSVNTYRKDHPDDVVKNIDARSYISSQNPAYWLWQDVCGAFDEIDLLIYSGHGSPLNLLAFVHAREDLSNAKRYFGKTFHFKAPWAKEATIILWGCNTGGTGGVASKNSIAQVISNKTGLSVFGYPCQTSQKLINGGYYQIPTRGDIVEFKPQEKK